jgi:MoaA/NifB/PqqE/SkfB family radical SAM enzyme
MKKATNSASRIQTFQKNPTHLVLELSRNCNLNCSMCGFGGKSIDNAFFMTDEILGHLLDAGECLVDIKEIRLNGRGESTLHPKFVRMLQLLRETFPNARLTLFTNLMMPDAHLLTTLQNFKVEIYVSIDSANHANYEKIRKGARYSVLIKRLPSIRNGFIVFTLQKDNFHEIEDIGEFAARFGLGLIINVIRTDDPLYRAEFSRLLTYNWEELLVQLDVLHTLIPEKNLLIPNQIWGRVVPEEIWSASTCGLLSVCPNILREIMIGYDGTTYPCNMFNPEIYGDLHSTSLRQIWDSERHMAFLWNHKRNHYCQNCQYMILKEA